VNSKGREIRVAKRLKESRDEVEVSEKFFRQTSLSRSSRRQVL
jgi:hypothetical protein